MVTPLGELSRTLVQNAFSSGGYRMQYVKCELNIDTGVDLNLIHDRVSMSNRSRLNVKRGPRLNHQIHSQYQTGPIGSRPPRRPDYHHGVPIFIIYPTTGCHPCHRRARPVVGMEKTHHPPSAFQKADSLVFSHRGHRDNVPDGAHRAMYPSVAFKEEMPIIPVFCLAKAFPTCHWMALTAALLDIPTRGNLACTDTNWKLAVKLFYRTLRAYGEHSLPSGKNGFFLLCQHYNFRNIFDLSKIEFEEDKLGLLMLKYCKPTGLHAGEIAGYENRRYGEFGMYFRPVWVESLSGVWLHALTSVLAHLHINGGLRGSLRVLMCRFSPERLTTLRIQGCVLQGASVVFVVGVSGCTRPLAV